MVTTLSVSSHTNTRTHSSHSHTQKHLHFCNYYPILSNKHSYHTSSGHVTSPFLVKVVNHFLSFGYFSGIIFSAKLWATPSLAFLKFPCSSLHFYCFSFIVLFKIFPYAFPCRVRKPVFMHLLQASLWLVRQSLFWCCSSQATLGRVETKLENVWKLKFLIMLLRHHTGWQIQIMF